MIPQNDINTYAKIIGKLQKNYDKVTIVSAFDNNWSEQLAAMHNEKYRSLKIIWKYSNMLVFRKNQENSWYLIGNYQENYDKITTANLNGHEVEDDYPP